MINKGIKVIIFDFDGVIAESVDVKTRAFRELFKSRSDKVGAIEKFHLENGGMSRFDKFRYIYKNILNEKLTRAQFDKLCSSFQKLVVDEVARSPYVRGAKGRLDYCRGKYPMYVVSGTPENEIRDIVRRRKLIKYFDGVYGSPAAKSAIIKKIIKKTGVSPKETIFIGDSINDYKAARKSKVLFAARIVGGRQEWHSLGYIESKSRDMKGFKKYLGGMK